MSDSATPWTVARQAPLSLGFSRQGYWSGLPRPPPGDLPDPGTESASPTFQADSLPSELSGKPWFSLTAIFVLCLIMAGEKESPIVNLTLDSRKKILSWNSRRIVTQQTCAIVTPLDPDTSQEPQVGAHGSRPVGLSAPCQSWISL